MRSALVGVVGHVDHGKSALVRALTGTETDRLAEEKARGLSIVLGFAVLRGDGAEIDLIDMPGHERFVRAMISGATGIDAVLLAVDANEGIKPQTEEHLQIAALLGVRRGVLAVTKCDLVSPERAAAVAEEVQALCRRNGIALAEAVATSVVTGQGIDALAAALRALGARPKAPEPDAPFHLPIDRSFSAKGFGSVVTGTLRGGTLRSGDEVEILPTGRRAEIRGLQVHGIPVETAGPGRRVAVNLRGIDRDGLPRGHSLATPDAFLPGRWLGVALSVPVGGEAVRTGASLSLLIGTREIECRLRLLDRDMLSLGESTVAQLKCADEIAVPAGEPFILRVPSPARTVAGGQVLDPVSRRRKRGDERGIRALRYLAEGRHQEAMLDRLREADETGLAVADAARLLRLGLGTARTRLQAWSVPLAGDVALHPDAAAAIERRLVEATTQHSLRHPLEDGLPLSAVAGVVGAPGGIVRALADRLVAKGVLVRRGGSLRPDAARPVREREQRLLREVEAAFAAGGLAPPDEADVVARDPQRAEAVRHLVRAGVLVRTTDLVQKRSILFHRQAVEAARRALAAEFGMASDGFRAREAGAVLGISRKFSIPLLEHLDAVGFTRRSGERRVFVAVEAGTETT